MLSLYAPILVEAFRFCFQFVRVRLCDKIGRERVRFVDLCCYFLVAFFCVKFVAKESLFIIEEENKEKQK